MSNSEVIKSLVKEGRSLFEKGNYEEAIEVFNRVRSIDSEGFDVSVIISLAACYIEVNELETAQDFLEKAITLHPNSARAHYCLGILLLLQGNFDRGWKEYEWVEEVHNKTRSLPSKHKWMGSSLIGKNIVLWDEQGFGDSLQFIRFAALLKLMGGEVFLHIKPPLRRLIKANTHLGHVMDDGTSVETDWWARLMSLPGLLRCNTSQSIPREVPYIYQVPGLEAPQVVHSTSKTKIGLAWKGNPENVRDVKRSIELQELKPLFGLSGFTFFSLQHLSCTNEATQHGLCNEIIDLASSIKDFADLAAIICHLDMVISVDTAVAHLAGAMGKPVWVLVPFIPDWRWLLEGQDSVWYPTMRLFRQENRNDWSTVIKRVTQELAIHFPATLT